MEVSITVKNVSALLYELSTDVDPDRDERLLTEITVDDIRLAVRALGFLIAQPKATCFVTDLIAELDPGSDEDKARIYKVINRFNGVFCVGSVGYIGINIATAQNDELT